MAPGLGAHGGTMAAPIVIPGLSSKKRSGQPPPRLLRKPRAPRQLPPLMTDEDDDDGTSYKKFSGYDSAIQMFQDTFDLDALRGVVPESDIPTDRGSAEPSLASPPPPSVSDQIEHHAVSSQSLRPVRVNLLPTFGSPGSGGTFISRDDMKYVLDPLFRDRTSLGTYVDGKSLVKPFKPRGPDPLPPRLPRRKQEIVLSYDADDQRFFEPPAFMLEHFIYKLAEKKNMSVPRVRKAMYSKHNVMKLTKILADELNHTNQAAISTQNLDSSQIPLFENRIPQRQLLYEMAALIKQHVREMMGADVKSVIKPMPKYSPAYTAESQPHTEIILYEDDTTERTSAATRVRQDTEVPGVDAVFHSAHSRYFQGSGRSRSPFAVPEDGAISPSELAILDSLIAGGTALSLKAHFIDELPDITPLMKTLTYLNLCFNNFTNFPLEVLNLSNLEVLKLRNNPIVEIPADINRLQKLKVFIASFCLITALPLSLFDMPNLEDVSVAYNRLTFIPREIANLKSLAIFDFEGNMIPALPVSILGCEQLKHVNMKNNLMHPLFWKENTTNKPQHLLDLACVAAYRAGFYKVPHLLSNDTIVALNRVEECDCCKGPLFGPGLRAIRPMPRLYNVKNVPLMFRICTPGCLHDFKHMSAENLRIILYGE